MISRNNVFDAPDLAKKPFIPSGFAIHVVSATADRDDDDHQEPG